jgi:hypothetical protein
MSFGGALRAFLINVFDRSPPGHAPVTINSGGDPMT